MKDWRVKQVQTAKPGRHRVSQSLYLFVSDDGIRRWIFRFTKPSTGRVSEHGLGSFPVVSLADARAKVLEARRMVAQGQDPVEAKQSARRVGVTFAEAAAEYLVVKARKHRNPHSTKSEQFLLFTHAAALGEKPIDSIGASHIAVALRSLWLKAHDQARRAEDAIVSVLKFAKASGHGVTSVGDIRDDLKLLLPSRRKEPRHHPAMNYAAIPGFVRELRERQSEAMSPCAIEFLLLTVARTAEVREMRWSEVDWEAKLWTLPGDRAKSGRVHRVPLSDRAMALLEKRREVRAGEYVWPGRDGKGPLAQKSLYHFLTKAMGLKKTACVHGFRSSFRDWAGDTTPFARDHIEECLSHQVGNAVERAYRRQDGLEKRRAILQAWAAYCSGS